MKNSTGYRIASCIFAGVGFIVIVINPSANDIKMSTTLIISALLVVASEIAKLGEKNQ